MKPVSMLCFWLGWLDSHVAAGRHDVGGTHDIRFCKVGGLVREFVGREPNGSGLWNIRVEPYPEAGLSAYDLTIAEYRGRRKGECALPAQFGGGKRAYPLWKRQVRPLRAAKTRVRDAILLIRDTKGRFHARMIWREHLRPLPLFIRRVLGKYDECGRIISVPNGYELMDLPLTQAARKAEPFLVNKEPEDRATLIKRVLGMRGAVGRASAGERYRRSRRLAEELKSLYRYRCQLCRGEIPRIHVGGDRFYVEVHHIKGLSETAPVEGRAAATQEQANLLLDRGSNLLVVCPHHHMVLHYEGGGYTFDYTRKRFHAKDGSVLRLARNAHL